MNTHNQVYEYGKVSEKEKGGEQAKKLSTNKVCVCVLKISTSMGRARKGRGCKQSHNEVGECMRRKEWM